MRLLNWLAGRTSEPLQEPSAEDDVSTEPWPIYPEPSGFTTSFRWPDPGAFLSLDGSSFSFVVNPASAADLFEAAYHALLLSHDQPSFAPRAAKLDSVLASDFQAIPDHGGPDGRFLLRITIAGKKLDFYADAQAGRDLLEDLRKLEQ